MPRRENYGNNAAIGTVLEYEESMRVWEEMKDTGELDSSDTVSEEEDELTGEDLLQAPDKALTAVSPPWPPRQGQVASTGLRGSCSRPSWY
jgi:hypothetical protein